MTSYLEIKEYISSCPCNNERWRFRFVPIISGKEHPKQLEEELSKAHLSIIPSDPSDARKKAVNHNRLVDSVRGGCIVVASPMLSYLELSKVALLGNEMPKLVDYAFNQYERLIEKYDRLRDSWLESFSPEVNHQNWINVIKLVQEN